MVGLSYLLLPLAGLAVVSDAVAAAPKPSKLPGTPVISRVYDNLVLYASYIHAGVTNPCKPPQGAFKVVDLDDVSSHTQATIFVSEQVGNIILAFPGAVPNDPTDIGTVLDQTLVKYADSTCTGCKVRRGVYNAWKSASPSFTAALENVTAQYPYPLVIAGYSLGGALAELAWAQYQSKFLDVRLFTYGAFRVGNKKFANRMNALSVIGQPAKRATEPQRRYSRVTFGADNRPQEPRAPLPTIGPDPSFVHWGTEFWISDYNNPRAQTTYLCVGEEPKTCINSAGYDPVIAGPLAHDNYPGLHYDCQLCGGQVCPEGSFCNADLGICYTLN